MFSKAIYTRFFFENHETTDHVRIGRLDIGLFNSGDF